MRFAGPRAPRARGAAALGPRRTASPATASARAQYALNTQGVVKGAEQLVAYFQAMAPLAQGNRHLTLNLIVEGGGAAGGAASARARACRLLHRAACPPALLASGVIEDELVKCGADGRWRFARRRFLMDPPAAPPAP